MQINSGGWPAPQRAVKLAHLGLLPDPFRPVPNIGAGVGQLAGEYAAVGQLQGALAAYNSGKPTGDAGYAAAVKAWLVQWEAPQLHVWTLNFVPYPHQAFISALNPVALVVTATAPLGPPVPVVWSKSRGATTRTCHTVTTTTPGTTVTRTVILRGPHGQRVAHTVTVTTPPKTTRTRTCTTHTAPAHPVTLPVRRVYDPTAVAANGHPMTPAGGLTGIGFNGDDPLYPGAGAWVLWATHAGAYRLTATWPGGLTLTRTVTVKS
jgi:hypothetical protein